MNRTITGPVMAGNRERAGLQPPSKIDDEAAERNVQGCDAELSAAGENA
jgi:hypothetical protein